MRISHNRSESNGKYTYMFVSLRPPHVVISNESDGRVAQAELVGQNHLSTHMEEEPQVSAVRVLTT